MGPFLRGFCSELTKVSSPQDEPTQPETGASGFGPTTKYIQESPRTWSTQSAPKTETYRPSPKYTPKPDPKPVEKPKAVARGVPKPKAGVDRMPWGEVMGNTTGKVTPTRLDTDPVKKDPKAVDNSMGMWPKFTPKDEMSNAQRDKLKKAKSQYWEDLTKGKRYGDPGVGVDPRFEAWGKQIKAKRDQEARDRIPSQAEQNKARLDPSKRTDFGSVPGSHSGQSQSDRLSKILLDRQRAGKKLPQRSHLDDQGQLVVDEE
jgi:hypothetical protein